MPIFDDYAADMNRALVDAADDSIFKQFMEPDDFESIVVTLDSGHGVQMQAQAQALARGSVRRVLERILAQARSAGADMKDWICSPSEFNLCAKLDTPLGKLMRQLHDFLENKWAEGGNIIADIFASALLGHFLLVFSAVGFVNKVFVELCDCKPQPKAGCRVQYLVYEFARFRLRMDGTDSPRTTKRTPAWPTVASRPGRKCVRYGLAYPADSRCISHALGH